MYLGKLSCVLVEMPPLQIWNPQSDRGDEYPVWPEESFLVSGKISFLKMRGIFYW